jgi:hypothetical protein
MATEIIRWCDVHMSRDERVTGTEVKLSIGGNPPKSLDLCPGCRDELIKPIEALLAEHGASVPLPAPKGHRGPRKAVPAPALLPGVVPADADTDRPHACLWCPATFTSQEGLLGHMMRKHGTSDRAGDVWGKVCPVCGHESEGRSSGTHIGQAHRDYGFPSVSQAFMWARDNGDPHGVYAITYAKGQPE